MAAVGIAGLMGKSKHSTFDSTEDEEEPMSKQLQILMERRRQEEVRKARHNWALLRNSIHSTVQAVQDADIKNVRISHGIHHQRKINHEKELKQVIFIKELDEYLTTDGQCIRTFMSDGRKKKSFATEEPVDNIAYCSFYKQYVGWFSGGDELFLMTNQFEIISQSRAPSRIVLAGYNKHTHEFITVGPGFFVTWAFRYGARHLIPRKMNRTEFRDHNMFTNMVLEGTASRAQKIFMSVQNSVVMYNVFEGTQLAYRQSLHERDITAMTYFNPLKYLVTGAIDGTIKVWDQKWHVQMVFVGHTGMVNALDIYPHGSAIISASLDRTIRVWNLDTCDEVDRAVLNKPVRNLQTTLDCDIFYTYEGDTVDLWKIQHLFQIHTSLGQRPVKIRHTSHPNYSVRTVVMSRDSSVRIISPVSGDIITTLLLNPHRNLVDIAYAIEEDKMFCVLSNGDILKVHTNTNPCRIVDEWECPDPEKEACNYLFVYEYVVDIDLKTDTWAAIKRGVATKSLQVGGEQDDEDDDESSSKKKKKRNVNRTLLLGGRKDGYICVFNWDTGEVDFKIDAHGSKGVMSMIANAKVDQLISAGRDNVIKVWRVYPFVQESLAPLMSFFCAHLPLHMTMIKTNLCVAFQDHSTATYSVVMYNLRDRNRYDHEPADDHTESISGLTACSRLKLYASCSLDGTIRVWNETNTLVRMLQLKAVPYSVGFCSARGDLLVGIGDHLYKIPHYVFLPKAYMFKMVSMKFTEQKAEGPLPENSQITQKMSKNDLSRMKNSHSSFKFTTFTDILTPAEEEEINRERLIKEKAFNILQLRENELYKIKEGDLISSHKPKTTARTKKLAFNQYMKMFYDKPKPTIPKDDPYPEDRVKAAVKTPEPIVEPQWEPEKEPTGFFPPASEAVKPKPPADSPLKGALPLTPSGYIPNSILVKLLWPQETKDKYAEKLKKEEWKLPSFSLNQLNAIAKHKQEQELLQERQFRAELQKWPSVDSWRVKSSSTAARSEQSKAIPVANEVHSASGRSQKSVSFEKYEIEQRAIRYERRQQSAPSEIKQSKGDGDGKQVSFLEEDEEFDDRVMQMDWGEDEEEDKLRESPNIFDTDHSSREKSKVSEADAKPAIPNKFADVMARAPTPKVDEEEELLKESTQFTSASEKTPGLGSKQPTEEKQISDVSSKASSKKELKPVKPIKKLISRPPPPPAPPKEKSPEPVRPAPTPSEKPRSVSRTKSRSDTPPPPRPVTPLPGFIVQFKGVAWFDKFYPGCNVKSIPKPWSLENFVNGLIKLLRTADYVYKTPILEAIMMLHAQDELESNLCHAVIKALSAILNNQKTFPTSVKEDEKNFIIASVKAIQKLSTLDKEFITEAIVQFLDGDKEVRFVVMSMFTNMGLQDPHKHIPKEFDSWDIWNVDEDDRKADLRKMTQQWMDRWMTSYKLHLEDAIERMKKGQNIHGRMTRDQLKKRGSVSGRSILRRSVGVGTDAINEDQETVTTLDDIPKRGGVTVTFDRPPDPSLLENASFIDALNFFCDMMIEKELESMKGAGKKMPGSKENVVQAKNTVLVLPKIPHKPSLVRLGETHTSHCRPHRETNLHVDYRLPQMTARGYNPLPGQISGFVNSINLPLKTVNLNPFKNILDEFDARFQEPILITLKSSQKYFIPSQSVVSQEVAMAL